MNFKETKVLPSPLHEWEYVYCVCKCFYPNLTLCQLYMHLNFLCTVDTKTNPPIRLQIFIMISHFKSTWKYIWTFVGVYSLHILYQLKYILLLLLLYSKLIHEWKKNCASKQFSLSFSLLLCNICFSNKLFINLLSKFMRRRTRTQTLSYFYQETLFPLIEFKC